MTKFSPQVRTLILGGSAGCAAAAVWLLAPHHQAIANAGVLLASLVPFVLATETVAAAQPAWFDRRGVREGILVGFFVLVYCYFAPKMFDRSLAGDFDHFYDLVRTLMPLLILCFVAALRLGGGSAATVRRVAYASILIMLSGLEDALFWVWRGQPVPATWTWASHITVLLGHVASRNEAYAFIAVHLLLALAVLLIPASAGRRLVGLLRRTDAEQDIADHATLAPPHSPG